MAKNERVKTHPAWEDWLGLGLGVLIIFTPSITGDAVDKNVQLATTVIGFLILFSAFIERLQVLERQEEPAREWEELAEGLFGVMLIALPFIFGYATSGTLRYWHFALGGIVLLLALYELRRDWAGDIARQSRQ
jgi:uncharacterized membrane protein